MRIDAHQHFWCYTPEEYGWIRTDVLKHDFTPEDVQPLLVDAGFDGTIAVQARSAVEETEWLLGLSDLYPFIVGVVGWLDVSAPDLPAQLERFCAHPTFCGVRSSIETETGDATHPTTAFVRGLQTLANFDKTFDLLIRPVQLPLACALAEAVPDLRFVLDHIANPDIDGTISLEWERGIRHLASHPHVMCKVSGMVTRVETDDAATQSPTPLPAFSPYLDHIVDAFGCDRLMIGSDWPVCTQAATYQQTMGIVVDYVSRRTPVDRDAILGETAKRAYKRQ